MNNISRIDKVCVGCRACEQLCPRQCIMLKPDREGFLYPVVDKANCINCGVCLKHCAQAAAREINGTLAAVFAVKNKEQAERFCSASGGASDVAVKTILNKGGTVFGAAYTKELQVCHIAITKESERERLRSSKYVQSDIRGCYTQAKFALEAGKAVLFTGTPCQIDGLYAFLPQRYENLYTIDLICHGVPSPELFKKYIEHWGIKLKEPVAFYNFRSKEKRGWGSQYHLKLETQTKKKIKIVYFDKYGSHFMAGDCYRECCYQCQYANLNRPADLTVGDFWGVEKFYPAFYSAKGVSAVLINTDKGKELFDAMKASMEYIPVKLEEVLLKQGNLKSPTQRPQVRDTIYSRLYTPGYIQKLPPAGTKWKEIIKAVLPQKALLYLKKKL